MHWTAGFRFSRVASAIGPPPVMRIVIVTEIAHALYTKQ